MELNKLKKLASRTIDVGVSRIAIKDTEKAKDAITREDVRQLVKEKVIAIKPKTGTSRARARIKAEKKKKGRGRGYGKRKGTKKARTGKKKEWMKKVRAQRKKLKAARPKNYRELYKRVKAGFFKSVKHLQSTIESEGT